jgi:hypothetical protein
VARKRYQLRAEACHLFFQQDKSFLAIARRLRITRVVAQQLVREGMWTPADLRRLRKKEGRGGPIPQRRRSHELG